MAEVVVSEVRKAYGAVEVIHGIDVETADGEFVVLVGPSGCGKSTLLRMIAGLEDVTSGDIRIGPHRVNHLSPNERDIAMVFQSYALYPHKTVEANMGFALKLQGDGPRRDPRRVAGRRRDPGPCAVSRPLSAGAVGRPAPARGHGPGNRAQPAGLPVRRAAVKSRRQAAGADAHRDPRVAPAAADHDRLRHPRPDRGDDHGRQDRRAERRSRGADRQPAASL